MLTHRTALFIAVALTFPPLALAADAPPPPPPPAPHHRIESIDVAKIVTRRYQRGDSIDKPSGVKQEFRIGKRTRFLNIVRKEVEDPKLRERMFKAGTVVIVVAEKTDKKDDKPLALVIQLVGG